MTLTSETEHSFAVSTVSATMLEKVTNYQILTPSSTINQNLSSAETVSALEPSYNRVGGEERSIQ